MIQTIVQVERREKAVVYKYSLKLGQTELRLPRNAEILHFGFQEHQPMLWARVNPKSESDTVLFQIVETGQEVQENAIFVQTCFDNDFVWHLFVV